MDNIIAPPDKYFYTVDGKILTNLYQLLDYIRECASEHYDCHVNTNRNDFYNWVHYVFSIEKLAESIKASKSREEMVLAISNYFDALNKSVAESKVTTANVQLIPATNVQQIPTADVPSVNPAVTVDDKKGFRSWEDEELEKFTKFGIKDKMPDNEKAVYLKYELNELRNMIKELRKNEKNTTIPDLLLRALDSKIAYYELSANQDDYDKVIQVFNDVKREIDYCAQEQPYSFADEIIRGLELQKITMKKT